MATVNKSASDSATFADVALPGLSSTREGSERFIFTELGRVAGNLPVESSVIAVITPTICDVRMT